MGAEENEEAVGNFIGATRANLQIAVEIKELRGQSVIVELDLPLQFLVVDIEQTEVKKWIPDRPIEKLSKM